MLNRGRSLESLKRPVEVRPVRALQDYLEVCIIRTEAPSEAPNSPRCIPDTSQGQEALKLLERLIGPEVGSRPGEGEKSDAYQLE